MGLVNAIRCILDGKRERKGEEDERRDRERERMSERKRIVIKI